MTDSPLAITRLQNDTDALYELSAETNREVKKQGKRLTRVETEIKGVKSTLDEVVTIVRELRDKAS